MIFRPRKPISILGFKLWGLIPKRKADLAIKIGETIEKELISHEDIHAVVNTASFHEEIINSVMTAVDRFIVQKLTANPLLALFMSQEIIGQVKELIKNEIRTILPVFLESMFEKIENRLDFKEIVRKKIEDFDLARLEAIIYNISSRELKAIEILGGVLGVIIGFIQVLLLMIFR